ncbi:MAG TPA: SDR family NAD(P)-dependent oxidoreductase [Candidatus Acidoferrales bacterium]|nr:SDR family NAD(P)-dependent oxidoreductase [Candidatus Acidoferrales bacterium]
MNILITGANRGLGAALVEEALKRGVARVYAATRQPYSHPDPRVTNLVLDITNQAQVEEAARQVPALDVLINNAGYAGDDDLTDRAALERHLAVNLFGPFTVINAFLPVLKRSQHAVILNVLSTAALAALPIIPSYAISKAAAFSFSQSLRARLRGQVKVAIGFPGPIDTEMSATLDAPKASPQSVAAALLDGLHNGEEDIFPDPSSAPLAAPWRDGALKAMEREFAAI